MNEFFIKQNKENNKNKRTNSFGLYNEEFENSNFNYNSNSSSRSELYVVKSGDSLSKIAKKYGVPVKTIMDENNLSSTTIYPKQVIVIPMEITNVGMFFEEYEILPNETLEIIANKLGVTPDLISRYNDISRLILMENQTLKIPKVMNTHTIMENDTLESILKKYNMTAEELIEYNNDSWLRPFNVINVK